MGGLDRLGAAAQTGSITPIFFRKPGEMVFVSGIHSPLYFLSHTGVCGVVWVDWSAVIKINQQTKNPVVSAGAKMHKVHS